MCESLMEEVMTGLWALHWLVCICEVHSQVDKDLLSLGTGYLGQAGPPGSSRPQMSEHQVTED